MLSLAILIYLIWTKPFPSAFDELEHVSYAAYVQETLDWRPMFEVMQTLDPAGLGHWDQRPNYLGHPAPFYWYESLFLDRTMELHRAVTAVRAASGLLLASGVLLALLAGWQVFGHSRAATLVFGALVALCPKLLAVGGQVTNDALAVLAGGLAYWGLVTDGRRGWAAAGAGLTLACWAKPNAALAVGAVLGIYALLRLRERPGLPVALLLGGLAGSVPYGPIYGKYGALVPITVEQFGQVHQVPGWEYGPVFFVNVAYTFCFSQTGTWPLPDAAGLVMAGLVWTLLLLAAVTGAAAAVRTPRRTAEWITIAAPLAFSAVLPIHLYFSAVKLGGSVPAASFRYYLPIWPFLVHGLAHAVQAGPAWCRVLVSSLAGAALLVGWLSP